MVDINELLENSRKNSKMKIVAKDFSMATASYDIFFSGCKAEPKCEGCHNPEAWSFDIGTPWIQQIMDICRDIRNFNNVVKRIFIMGGEPLDQDRDAFLLFLEGMRELNKELWLFTHYELDEVPTEVKELVDYIKTGRYKPELSTEDNICYGVKLATSNQKVYKKGLDY